MADFLNSEAESDNSEEEGLDQHERKKLKKLKAMSDSEEEEDEDDEERIREELKDLIDDNPIDDESDGDDSEDSDAGRNKRKKSDDDDDLDDRLEDDDYDLIEENLGVKVERQKFKRLKRFDEESDGEDQMDDDRDAIANQLFDGDDDVPQKDDERRVERHNRTADLDQFDEDDEDEESDADDFIVDDDGRPISEKKKKSKPRFHDQSLQEGQDIFGVDFDYDEFEKYDEDEYEEESDVDDDEYEDEDAERQRRNKKASRKKTMKKSIFEIYEPSELKRGHFTDLDNQIRKTDIPERMQLREVPVTKVPEGSNELDDEAEWIYEQAFCRPTISDQASFERDQNKKPQSTITKIKQALDFMRNQQLEVPFIAFYRKEYVQPELNINDLWKIYKYDARWCQLLSRKRNLLALFEKMRNFQLDKITENNETVPDDMRVLKDDDIERLKAVATPEELKDVHMQFLLYYASDIAAMKEDWLQKEKEKRRRERLQAKRKALEAEDGNVEDIELDDEEDEDLPEEPLKQARDTGPYAMCRKAGICGLAKRFGLTPEQFAMNLRDHYQRHEVEQEEIEPLELAKEYVSPKFTTSDEVIHAAKFVVARQISKEPMLRKTVREIFFERAKITVAPTKKGLKEIDENHPCFSLKYLKEKPVRHLKGIQFLRLCMAEEDKLITIIISDKINGNVSNSYLEEVKSLYQRDEFSKTVQDWNALRAECVELALNKMVLPDMRKELKSILLNEAKDAVLEACAQKLCGWLKMAPFKAKIQEEDDYDWETSKGIRVMGLAYVDDYSQAAFCALIGPDGDVTDYLRLPHILKRKNAFRSDEKEAKEAELITLQNFIRNKKPHVITIGGESRDALTIQQDIRGLIKQLNEEEQFPMISVEINDNELAKIYSNSVKGTSDFREYPDLLRQAVSLARRIQDPLVEYSQLCTADEEILCLRYHTLQDQLNKEELLDALYTEFINRTNEVGVDINQATQNPLTVNLVQFICGLGPRKGQALIKLLKQTNQRLENRTQLVTNCHMGPKVFINCSGFIKIDTNALGDSTEAYVEVLDGSRVHPETYEWARKMAVDALEYDDEDLNPAGALEEILESPERLKDLDLDAFAVELERQGFGNKSITLYDIREELNSRYKDLRQSYRTATAEQMFNMLTKETPEAFYVGKMVLAQVIGFSYKKPQADQLDQANPVRNDETRLWQCPFCMKNDFPELSEVWNHFDAGACPGQATGVKLRLDNGLSGFIHIKNLSDKHVKNPEERVQIGQTIHCRITKIDIERFSVDCTSKSSDLLDKNNEWRPSKDQYYDQEAEDKDLHKEDQSKQHRASQQYVRRVIFHPSFHNKSYAEAATLMKTMDQGEVIVRPSSKGTDHLTVMWKVTDEIYQHIDIREEGKENAFSLGQSLWIGNEEFEDLDEIIARHVNPMAAYARDLLGYKYYRDSSGGMKDKMEEFLKEEKRKNANKIHYFLSASKNYPGKFLLSYLPRNKCRHEYVTVTPDGFRFRQQMFDSVNSLLKWFKEHFRDPIPVATPIASTPHGSQSNRTPYGTPLGSTSAMSTEAIHKVAQNMPSHIMHSLSQVANQTPHYTQTPGYGQGGYVNTPYTPSGQTPFMTPYQTPHTSQTPRYGQGTPNQHSSGPFAHPGAPISAQRGGYPQASPHSYRSSPHVPSPRNRGGSYSTSHNKDNEDWDRASDAWASKTSRYSGGSRGSSGGGNWEKPNRPAWGRGGDRDRGGHNNRYNSKPQNTMPTITTTADEEDWDDAPSTEKSQPPKSTNSSSNYSNSNWNQNSRSNYKNNSYSTSGGASTSKDDRGWNKPNKGQPVILQNAADDEDWDNDVGSSNNLSEPSRDYQTMPSPRSVRSTPGTNTSPRSMTIGDATPLYDEN